MLFFPICMTISSIPISLNPNVTFLNKASSEPYFKVQALIPPQIPSPISFSIAFYSSAIIHNLLFAMSTACVLECQLQGTSDLSMFKFTIYPVSTPDGSTNICELSE